MSTSSAFILKEKIIHTGTGAPNFAARPVVDEDGSGTTFPSERTSHTKKQECYTNWAWNGHDWQRRDLWENGRTIFAGGCKTMNPNTHVWFKKPSSKGSIIETTPLPNKWWIIPHNVK